MFTKLVISICDLKYTFSSRPNITTQKQKTTFSMLIRVQKVKRSPIVFAVSLGSDTEEEAVESIR